MHRLCLSFALKDLTTRLVGPWKQSQPRLKACAKCEYVCEMIQGWRLLIPYHNHLSSSFLIAKASSALEQYYTSTYPKIQYSSNFIPLQRSFFLARTRHHYNGHSSNPIPLQRSVFFEPTPSHQRPSRFNFLYYNIPALQIPLSTLLHFLTPLSSGQCRNWWSLRTGQPGNGPSGCTLMELWIPKILVILRNLMSSMRLVKKSGTCIRYPRNTPTKSVWDQCTQQFHKLKDLCAEAYRAHPENWIKQVVESLKSDPRKYPNIHRP